MFFHFRIARLFILSLRKSTNRVIYSSYGWRKIQFVLHHFLYFDIQKSLSNTTICDQKFFCDIHSRCMRVCLWSIVYTQAILLKQRAIFLFPIRLDYISYRKCTPNDRPRVFLLQSIIILLGLSIFIWYSSSGRPLPFDYIKRLPMSVNGMPTWNCRRNIAMDCIYLTVSVPLQMSSVSHSGELRWKTFLCEKCLPRWMKYNNKNGFILTSLLRVDRPYGVTSLDPTRTCF